MSTPSTVNCFLKTTLVVLLLFCRLAAGAQQTPLPNAFAHNDYIHKRPLFEALDNGYANIEADIFLLNDELVVAHMFPYFRQERTLERLYLQPLQQRIKQNDGWVYKGYTQPVILMIDIKTGAANTYYALERLLQRYSDILTSYDNGQITPRQVTVVISGHKPYFIMAHQQHRLAFIDEDLRHAPKDTLDNRYYAMASCPYSKMVHWAGKGNFPDAERRRLLRYIDCAHRYGRKVRLWASPEDPIVWAELLKCGVDLINTDRLVALRDYFISNSPSVHSYVGLSPGQ